MRILRGHVPSSLQPQDGGRAEEIEKKLLDAKGEERLRLAVDRAELARFARVRMTETESVDLAKSIREAQALDTTERLLLEARLWGASGDDKKKMELLALLMREHPKVWQAYLCALESTPLSSLKETRERYVKIFEELEEEKAPGTDGAEFYYTFFRIKAYPDVAGWITTTRNFDKRYRR